MRRALPWLFFAALAAAPFLPLGHASGLVVLLAGRVMVFALAALSLDLLVGVAGLVSFGHAACLAIGAYAVAMLDANDLNQAWIVLPAALAAGALFASATGAVALRTRGVNFIMITLAFAQMAYFALAALPAYGGDDGYTLLARTSLGGRPLGGAGLYAASFVLLLAAWLAARALLASRFGRVLRAARQNPARVAALGFNPFAYRLAALAIAGALASLAGALLANAAEFASPAYGAWQRSGDLLIMVILGGAGSLQGALLGAGLVVLLEEALGDLTDHWRLIYGPLLILAVLFLRGGLAGARRHG